jgi:ubiquinone/menaquinone biosynthesis C-methylase UbiE
VGGTVTEACSDPDPADWTDPAPVYDEVAASYAEKFLTELTRKPFDRDLLDRFAESVQRRASAERPVCDLGCGPGHIGAYLAGHGIPMVGIDLSAGMVAEGRRAFPEISFSQGDMTGLEQPDGAFTAITCFYAIIHLPRATVPQALAEMRRTLVGGGELLLSAHGGEGSLHADHYFDYEVSLYATLFSLAELTGLVEAAGLEVRESHQREPYEDELATPRLYVWATAPGA